MEAGASLMITEGIRIPNEQKRFLGHKSTDIKIIF
jgi:hypothetical protein